MSHLINFILKHFNWSTLLRVYCWFFFIKWINLYWFDADELITEVCVGKLSSYHTVPETFYFPIFVFAQHALSIHSACALCAFIVHSFAFIVHYVLTFTIHSAISLHCHIQNLTQRLIQWLLLRIHSYPHLKG